MGDVLAHNDREVSLHRLVLGHRLGHRHHAGRHGVERQLEHHGGTGQFPGLTPTGVQLAHMADHHAVHQHLGRTPGVQRGVFGGCKGRLAWSQQLFHIGLHVVKINVAGLALPAQGLHRAPSHASHAHGLVKALHRGVGALNRGVAQEHATQLEHAHAVGLAVGVELDDLQQRADQARAHHAHLAGDRVEQANWLGVARQVAFPGFFYKAVVDGFLITQSGNGASHGGRAALGLAAHLGGDGGRRWVGRQVVVAHHAGHFLNQVFLDLQVKAETGRRHGNGALAFAHLQAQTTQCVGALLLRERHADDFDRTGHAQRDGCDRGHIQSLVVDGADLGVGRAANVQHQLGDALDVLHRQLRVNATLEAVTGIGREVVPAGTPGNGRGPPEGCFDVDVLRVIRHGSGVTAHDARERFDLAVVGDHAHLVVHGHGIAVEQLERFTCLAPTHLQAAVDLVEVKNVRRATELEHHVVGDVHQRTHAALTATGQAVHHPLRSLGLRVHAFDHATAEAATQVGGLHLHSQLVGDLRGHGRESRSLERCTRQGRHFAGDAVDTQAMRQIGRELERHQGVVQIEILANVLTQGGVCGQLQQAAMVVGNLQLFGRAQHALAFNAAQLADLDDERLAVFAWGQFGPHQGARHADAHAGIGRAADDIQQSALPHVHLAHAQAVGVGVLHGILDFTDHDLGERRGHGLEFFHFEAGHGQGVGQLLGRQGRVAEFAQPGFGKLHVSGLGLELLELAQETHIAVKEQAQVVHAIAQHGETVHAHAKGKADETLGVQTHVAHHVRVHLT